MKLAILVSHPIQYLVPLYRHLSEDPDIDVTVYFCTDMGVNKAAHDEQFGVAIKWDIPLLEGYTHRFLRNRARRPRLGTHFSGVVNWDIISILRKERPDAILIPGWAYASYVIGAWAAMAFRIPIWLRMEAPWNQEALRVGWKQRLRRSLLGAFLVRRASRCLYIGTQNRAFYEHLGVPPERLFSAPYCVDNARFSAQARDLRPQREALRTGLGVPTDAVVFLFLGKLMAKKRPIDLLQATQYLLSTATVRPQPMCSLLETVNCATSAKRSRA